MPVPIKPIELTEQAKSGFWNRVDRRGPDECWPWLGKRPNEPKLLFEAKVA